MAPFALTPLVFYDAVAGSVFALLFFVWIATELRLLWRRRAHDVHTAHGAALSLIVFPWLGLWAAALLAEDVPALSFSAGPVPVAVGLALVCCGILLRASSQRAFVTLGRGVEPSGPYRYIRHPSLAASLLTMLGFGLALSNWASLCVCVLVPLVGYLQRISAEESELAALFGSGYRRYASETARLVPGVW